MTSNNFAAGIILYNPNIERLKDNIESIYKQVKTVYCFNNNSQNITDIKKVIEEYPNVVLLDCEENLGIASAINIIANVAIENKVTWLLTLDQDSICPIKMVENFKAYIDIPDVGIICPLMLDKRRPLVEPPKEHSSYVEFCITSGSFMNLRIFEKLHGLDDKLFIGLVDDEYCYRLRLNGFKILQINKVVLDHELGDLTPSKHAQLFLKLGSHLHSKKLKALSYKRNVSPMRVYYATRNIIYLSEKYKKHSMPKFSVNFAVRNGLSNIIRSKNKILVFKAFIKGMIAGKKMNK